MKRGRSLYSRLEDEIILHPGSRRGIARYDNKRWECALTRVNLWSSFKTCPTEGDINLMLTTGGRSLILSLRFMKIIRWPNKKDKRYVLEHETLTPVISLQRWNDKSKVGVVKGWSCIVWRAVWWETITYGSEGKYRISGIRADALTPTIIYILNKDYDVVGIYSLIANQI